MRQTELNTLYLEKIHSDYQKSSKRKKTQLLNEAERFTNLSRSQLKRLLGPKKAPKRQKKPGRPRSYTSDFDPHILKLHWLMEEVSSKRMVQAIPLWLSHYERHYGPLCSKTRTGIERISASTIDRILERNRDKIRGISSTRPNYKLKSEIPIKRLDENVTAPGTVQADTVVHCGTSLMGAFISTLTMVDVHSSWTENRATWTKSSEQILKAITDIEENLPFPMKYFDTDCGTEFLNYKTMRYFERRKKPVKMRRSRPYKKNDQCYVEQKNYTHVRNLFAYDRLDADSLIPLMNDIYKNYWNILHNYFLPSFKLESKTRIGGKIKKKYEKPKSPAQRLIESADTKPYYKKQLHHNLKTIDPVALKQELENKLKKFYMLLKYEQGRKAS